MSQEEGRERLGIEGYPAEGGLFDSILLKADLYRKDEGATWRFSAPSATNDRCRLLPAWSAALEMVRDSPDKLVNMQSVLLSWQGPLFGIVQVDPPILEWAFILANRGKLGHLPRRDLQSRFHRSRCRLSNERADSSIQLRWPGTPLTRGRRPPRRPCIGSSRTWVAKSDPIISPSMSHAG